MILCLVFDIPVHTHMKPKATNKQTGSARNKWCISSKIENPEFDNFENQIERAIR